MKKEPTKLTGPRVRQLREARGLRAAELAAACGIRRQTVYAIEDGSYVPNTVIAIRLARILRSSVEELFPVEEPDDFGAEKAELLADSPVRIHEQQLIQLVTRAGHLLALPLQPDSSFLPMFDGIVQQHIGGRATIKRIQPEVDSQEALVVAGCDPALSILQRHVETAGVKVATLACSSRQALELLKLGKVDLAGCHLRDSTTGDYNLPLLRTMFKSGTIGAVHFAAWEQGILSRKDARKRPRAIADFGSADFEIINREPGSGTRALLDDYLQKEGISARRVPGYKRIATGHLAAAFAVASGSADCCIATNSAARCFGLRFIPVRQECFDLAFRPSFAASKPGQVVLDVLNRAATKRELSSVAGYETARTGSKLL